MLEQLHCQLGMAIQHRARSGISRQACPRRQLLLPGHSVKAMPRQATGYEGAGQGVHVPFKRLGDGNVLAVDHLAYNALQHGLRALGERGFALLTTRWRALQRITASPSRIGDIVGAGMMLTQFEQRDSGQSC